MVVPPQSADSPRYSGGSLSESEDMYMTINTEFCGVDHPKPPLTKEFSQNERQISMDPISFQGSPNFRQASFRLVSTPSNKGFDPSNPVPSPPSKLKFVSASLPSSASSSPHSTSLLKKLWRSHNGHNKPHPRSNLSRVQSTMDDTQLAMVETSQRRSRSLGASRRSSTCIDDFDLWLEKPTNRKNKSSTVSLTQSSNIRNYSKPPLGTSTSTSKSREQNYPEDGFNCGKLCLFLPRGKGKPIRSISDVSSTQVSIQMPPVISRRVSLERFECGSSLHDDDEGDATNLFFDLPVEMLRCSVSDMQSAVTAAFVFDNEDDDDHPNNHQEDFKAFLEAQT